MDGGGTPRPRGAAFPIFGEAQTQRIAGAAGSVRVRCFVDSLSPLLLLLFRVDFDLRKNQTYLGTLHVEKVHILL